MNPIFISIFYFVLLGVAVYMLTLLANFLKAGTKAFNKYIKNTRE